PVLPDAVVPVAAPLVVGLVVIAPPSAERLLPVSGEVVVCAMAVPKASGRLRVSAVASVFIFIVDLLMNGCTRPRPSSKRCAISQASSSIKARPAFRVRRLLCAMRNPFASLDAKETSNGLRRWALIGTHFPD